MPHLNLVNNQRQRLGEPAVITWLALAQRFSFWFLLCFFHHFLVNVDGFDLVIGAITIRQNCFGDPMHAVDNQRITTVFIFGQQHWVL